MKTPKNKFRYKVINRLGLLQVQPLGESNLIIEWGRENDGKLDYKNEIPSKITFTGAAYQNLLKLEKSIYRCDFITITVERWCGSGWVDWFTGRLTNNDGTWDLDRCQVEIKLDDIKPDACYDANKGTELNLLSIPTRRSIMLNPGNVTVETFEATDNTCSNSNYWPGTDDPAASGWVPYSQHYEFYDPFLDVQCIRTTRWARETITLSCAASPPGPEWILVNDTCPGGTRVYARPARLFNCVFKNPVPGSNPQISDYTCSILGVSSTTEIIDNGISLDDAVNLFLTNFCPGKTFVSNFFQINPDVVSTINYVTGQPSKTRFITFFNKSDVKRPTVTGNATKALISWEKLFAILINMFNLRWRIIGNVFRMEHVSFFSKTQGFDLTQQRWAPWMIGKRKYSYQTEEIPAQEVFTFMEAGQGDFTGVPIKYSGGCVTQDGRNAIKTFAVEKVTTDMELCLANPDPQSKVVSDDGFVVVACDYDGTNYYVITESSILGGATLNNSLAWAQLQRDYYKWDRPLSKGIMNNQPTTFFSTKPTKKGEKITIPLCCGDAFNPDNLVKTPLGMGIVDKATFSFKDETLELDLLYAADQGLTQNAAPVANNDSAFTYENIPISIVVAANDTDPDPGTILGMPVIAFAPMHGTAVVQPNKTILYTPAPGYLGDDYFHYQIADDWGELSNVALVAIVVRAPNTAPVAVNDSYIGTKNTTLNIAPSIGLFINDSDDVSFTLDSFDAASVHGGTVTVNSDGSFSYTPATGYVGIDTFTYTIKDTPGLTDTATVTIDVRDPNNPVATDDGVYTTRRNLNLSIAAPGVLGNDTTAIGTLTATAGTFATTAGGSVTMNIDGSFTYFPLTGFTGLDTFTYTADNGTGTDTATVTIRVLPDVFVKLQQIPYSSDLLTQDCASQGYPDTGEPYDAGESSTAIFRLYFYADGGGVTPLDVTSLGVNVAFRVTRGLSGGGTTTADYTQPGNGTQTDIFGGPQEYYHNQFNCAGATVAYWNDTYSVLPGLYTII